jgi:hypothetical protein
MQMWVRLAFFWDKASSSKSNIPSLSVEKIDITIGDIAFVLLGQIVNRPYSFHQTDVWEDGVVSVVTISRQEVLSIAVRDYWSRDSISQQLLDSLVIDFCTRPVFHYGLPFGNHDSMPKKHALRLSDFPCVDPYTIQIGATARLIAFYPQESRDLIISRIKELTLTEWETLHIDNEIHVLDFLFECSKSKDQKILDAIKELYQRDKKNILKLDSHIPHLFQDPKQS